MPVSKVKKEIVKSCLTSNFLPAMLREYKSGWIVEYYAENPLTKNLERKKIRLTRLVSRYKSIKDARLHANKMVMALNIKLSTGWNPFFTDDDARLYTSVESVREKFLQEKEKEIRKDAMRSYLSLTSIFVNWLKASKNIQYFSMINRITAVKFMDYAYGDRNVSPTTYNSYLKFYRSFFNWAKVKCYTKENPFVTIKKKPKVEKKRIIIPSDTREEVANHILSFPEEKNYLIVLKLVYSALLRPSEIKKLKIENIDLKQKIIIVPGSISKNKKQRIVSLSEDVVNSLKMLNLDYFPKKYYAIGY